MLYENTKISVTREDVKKGLNPCFVGKCSTRTATILKLKLLAIIVLILVLLENALRGISTYHVQIASTVLILVLLENALRGKYD